MPGDLILLLLSLYIHILLVTLKKLISFFDGVDIFGLLSQSTVGWNGDLYMDGRAIALALLLVILYRWRVP